MTFVPHWDFRCTFSNERSLPLLDKTSNSDIISPQKTWGLRKLLLFSCYASDLCNHRQRLSLNCKTVEVIITVFIIPSSVCAWTKPTRVKWSDTTRSLKSGCENWQVYRGEERNAVKEKMVRSNSNSVFNKKSAGYFFFDCFCFTNFIRIFPLDFSAALKVCIGITQMYH